MYTPMKHDANEMTCLRNICSRYIARSVFMICKKVPIAIRRAIWLIHTKYIDIFNVERIFYQDVSISRKTNISIKLIEIFVSAMRSSSDYYFN